MTSSPSFVTVATGDTDSDTRIEVAVKGAGPLVLCIHGWPELWYSWRHQIEHLSDRYTVAAMNVRGYGRSSNPTDVESYTLRELAGDAAAVIQALTDQPAIVLGHDWGAPIAWNTARLHRESVGAVCGLSVPYVPVGPANTLDLWREHYTDQGRFFYQAYFDDNRGGAEAELAADHHRSLRMIYFGAAADGQASRGLLADKAVGSKMLDDMVDPDPFPAWCQPEDFDVYAAAFAESGWHGPLNRYRAQGLDAADLGHLSDPGPNLVQPAAFIGGAQDPVRRFMPGLDLYDFAPAACDDFRGTTIIEGAGHWVQQEAPEATNAAIDAFLATLG